MKYLLFYSRLVNMAVQTKNALKGPYWIGTEQQEGPLPKGLFPGSLPLTLVCILALKGARQGTTKSGTPLYMGYPLDPMYPPVIVGSRESDLTKNRFALVLVKEYEEAFRWPRAEFRSWIGTVGDPGAERSAFLLMSGSMASPPLTGLPIFECKPLHTWNTCNIDPSGCKDIDDVISWKLDGSTVVEVIISIADVSSFVLPGTPEDVEAACRGQSLYANGSVVSPMIHPLISEKAASLHADGVARPVVSLHLPSKTWSRGFLVNQKSYTYEEAIGNSLLKEVFTICGAVSDDPHEWIERTMVLYNVEAANRIKGVGILRTQAPPEAAKAMMWKAAAAVSGEPSLALLGYSAGLYAKEGAHWALGEEVYCHASSPLRRYADLVNQRCLVNLLDGKTPPSTSNILIESLNTRSRIAKQLDRSLLSIPLDVIIMGDGIIIDLYELNVGVYYLPWKSRITIRLLEPYKGAIGDRCCVKGFCDNTAIDLKRRMVWKIMAY
jgi:hypothetical protein